MAKKTLHNAAIGVFFAGLAALRMYPLILHLNQYIPLGKPTDFYNFSWNYWWVRHALMNGLPLYRTDYILQPMGEINVGVNAFTLIFFPIWAVIEPLAGSIAAMNIILWIGLILAGVWMYILLKEETGSTIIALLGGVILIVQPYLGHAIGLTHINFMGVFFYPLTVWVWKRVAQKQQIRWALLMGLIFWGMWLTDTMWLLLIPPVIGAYGLLTLFRAENHQAQARIILLGILAVVLFAALSWVLLPWQGIASYDNSQTSPANREAAQRWSVDAEIFLLQPGDVTVGRSVGRLLILLIAVCLFMRGGKSERWFWLALAILLAVLCIGTDITLFGRRIDLPYWYLHQAMGGMYRTPERYLPGFVFCACLFVGQSLTPHPKSLPHFAALRGRDFTPSLGTGGRGKGMGGITVIFLLLFLADLRALRPLPAGNPVPEYAFYEVMAPEDENYVVVDVPIAIVSGWKMSGTNYATQYYALTHGKRQVNGFVTRIPDFYHYYFEHEAVLGWLGGYHPFREEIIGTLEKYVYDLPIGYMVVHTDQTAPGQAEDILGHLNALDYLCPVTVEGAAVFYGTAAHADRCVPRYPTEIAPGTYRIDIGTPGDEFFIGLGFQRQEIIGGATIRWIGAADRSDALLYVELPPGQQYQLTLQATALAEPKPIMIYADEQILGTVDISHEGYGQASLPTLISGGKMLLLLDYGLATSPAERGLSADTRPLAVALDWIEFKRVD